jgi:hypothetical protein
MIQPVDIRMLKKMAVRINVQHTIVRSILKWPGIEREQAKFQR